MICVRSLGGGQTARNRRNNGNDGLGHATDRARLTDIDLPEERLAETCAHILAPPACMGNDHPGAGGGDGGKREDASVDAALLARLHASVRALRVVCNA